MAARTVTVHVYANDYVELCFIHKTADQDHKEVLTKNAAISLAQRIMETFRSPAVSSPQQSGPSSTDTSSASNSPKPAPQST